MVSYIVIGVIALLFMVFLFRGPSINGSVQAAVKDNDIKPLLEAVEGLSEARRFMFLQQAMDLLWNSWQRELGAQLLREFVSKHPNEKICQYWMRQYLELEGELAQKYLEPEFVEDHYQPEVAACCGVASS